MRLAQGTHLGVGVLSHHCPINGTIARIPSNILQTAAYIPPHLPSHGHRHTYHSSTFHMSIPGLPAIGVPSWQRSTPCKGPSAQGRPAFLGSPQSSQHRRPSGSSSPSTVPSSPLPHLHCQGLCHA